MLVLTRRANQSIMIGDDIVVTVLDVRGDQVRIGIKAPRSVDVHREEVFVALQRNGGGRARCGFESRCVESRRVERRGAHVAVSHDVIDLDDIDAVEPVVAAPAE